MTEIKLGGAVRKEQLMLVIHYKSLYNPIMQYLKLYYGYSQKGKRKAQNAFYV